MLRDWALDILLRTERPGTIGHMVGGFLYDEPALGLEANEINEGIRSLCFLTRATKATAGYGEALATRFSVWTEPVSSTSVGADATGELKSRMPGAPLRATRLRVTLRVTLQVMIGAQRQRPSWRPSGGTGG